MLTVKKTNILENDLEYFLSDSNTIYLINEEKLSMNVLSATLHTIAQEADWNINSILENTIQDINDAYLRNWFRRFLIAQKYGILPRCPKGGSDQYVIVDASDDCVLVYNPRAIVNQGLIKPTSTIVLTPEGGIKIPEGKVWLNEYSLTSHGFTAKWNGKYGIFTRKGNVLFPCLFEDMGNSILADYGCVRYKGFAYLYKLRGTFPVVKPEAIKDDKTISFCCENKVYSIAPLGENYSQENLDELSGILYSLHEKTA